MGPVVVRIGSAALRLTHHYCHHLTVKLHQPLSCTLPLRCCCSSGTDRLSCSYSGYLGCDLGTKTRRKICRHGLSAPLGGSCRRPGCPCYCFHCRSAGAYRTHPGTSGWGCWSWSWSYGNAFVLLNDITALN